MKKRFALMLCLALVALAAVAEDNLPLPVGTAVKMKLETGISTRANKAGEVFSGRVTEAVLVEGKTVLPVGATVQGHVTRITEPRRIKGTPTINLRPETVTLPNGTKFTLNAVVVDTDHRPEVDVNDEGEIKGRGYDSHTTREVAIGTGAGVGVGALAAGGTGALVGAGVGATATVAHWLTGRRSAELPAGTEIIIELSRPMTLSAAGAGR
jgi:hypothetical protein